MIEFNRIRITQAELVAGGYELTLESAAVTQGLRFYPGLAGTVSLYLSAGGDAYLQPNGTLVYEVPSA
jgi:hypothetical protein